MTCFHLVDSLVSVFRKLPKSNLFYLHISYIPSVIPAIYSTIPSNKPQEYIHSPFVVEKKNVSDIHSFFPFDFYSSHNHNHREIKKHQRNDAGFMFAT